MVHDLLRKLFIISAFFSIISCRSIATRTYEINTPKLGQQSSITIVLISDLHSTIFKKDQTVLINKIKTINPDLIILSGDIYDSTAPMTGAQLLLSGISDIAPVYFVTGNHEYWGHNITAIREELSAYGVIILSDNYAEAEVHDNIIILAGIEDPDKKFAEDYTYNQFYSMERAFRELDHVVFYKILIAHRPELIEYYNKYSFDLVLSGHTHGGQVRFPPFINGLYARNQGIFPKYAGGKYKYKNLILIVSRGLSINYPKAPRIFNSPELVVIIIEPEN